MSASKLRNHQACLNDFVRIRRKFKRCDIWNARLEYVCIFSSPKEWVLRTTPKSFLFIDTRNIGLVDDFIYSCSEMVGSENIE